MWLFTPFGFFSVSQIADGRLQVRARVRDDLDALRTTYLLELSETVQDSGRDYRYRAFVSKEHFQVAVAKAVDDVTYSNFKATVAGEQGHARAAIYSKVWEVLHGLSDLDEEQAVDVGRPGRSR